MQTETMDTKYIHYQLTEKILGCCFDVINELGSGFLESVYQSALLIALHQNGLKAEKEVGLEVAFRGQIVGKFYADIVIENSVIIELKALKEIEPAHRAQLINYLKATKIKVGLLVNFGRQVLDYSRLHG